MRKRELREGVQVIGPDGSKRTIERVLRDNVYHGESVVLDRPIDGIRWWHKSELRKAKREA